MKVKLSSNDAKRFIKSDLKKYQDGSVDVETEYEKGFVKGLEEAIKVINRSETAIIKTHGITINLKVVEK